jgi:serine/threonine protein phosphatase 1
VEIAGETRLRRDEEMSRRLIAIGDIHGCSTALRSLIEAIQPGAEDTLVLLGDFIDRGPDTRGVLDQLIGLSGRCRLIPILSNHEGLLIDSLESRAVLHQWLGLGGRQTLDSYDKRAGPGRGVGPEIIPLDHFRFLFGCCEYYETETHIFVHANYHPSLPMDHQPGTMLRWTNIVPERQLPHCSGKTVIAGHTAGEDILDLGFLKCIDTNCYGGGWLTALEIETGKVTQANQWDEVRLIRP